MAIRDFSKAIELNPKNAIAYLNRCNAYLNLSNYNAAIQDCNKAIEFSPQNANAYKNRGIAHEKLNNTNAAVDDFNSYLRINGNKDGDAEKVRQEIRNLGYTPQY
jgi:tetratricopeptide (TPR) repeat protein